MSLERQEAEEIGLEWLDRVWALDADLVERMAELAEFAEIAARRPDAVQPGGALRTVATVLRKLAAEVAG